MTLRMLFTINMVITLLYYIVEFFYAPTERLQIQCSV